MSHCTSNLGDDTEKEKRFERSNEELNNISPEAGILKRVKPNEEQSGNISGTGSKGN